jgi:hypothetical protein
LLLTISINSRQPLFVKPKDYNTVAQGSTMVIFFGCWKWFNGVLKEANMQITDANKDKAEDVIHKYIGEQSSYGNCSADWKKAYKEINESPKMKQELLEKFKATV